MRASLISFLVFAELQFLVSCVGVYNGFRCSLPSVVSISSPTLQTCQRLCTARDACSLYDFNLSSSQCSRKGTTSCDMWLYDPNFVGGDLQDADPPFAFISASKFIWNTPPAWKIWFSKPIYDANLTAALFQLTVSSGSFKLDLASVVVGVNYTLTAYPSSQPFPSGVNMTLQLPAGRIYSQSNPVQNMVSAVYQNAIFFDPVPPMPTFGSVTAVSNTLNFAIVFSEAVSKDPDSRLLVVLNNLPNASASQSLVQKSSTTWQCTLTVIGVGGPGTVSVSVPARWARDIVAQNPSNQSSVLVIAFDNQPPVPTFKSNFAAGVVGVDFVFDETIVYNTSCATPIVAGVNSSCYSSLMISNPFSNQVNFRVMVNCSMTANLSLTVGGDCIIDYVGNKMVATQTNIFFDFTPLSLRFVSPSSPSRVTPVVFGIVFCRSPVNFNESTITVRIDNTLFVSNVTAENVNSTMWNLSFPLAKLSCDPCEILLSVESQAFKDAYQNANQPTTSSPFLFDNTSPSVLITGCTLCSGSDLPVVDFQFSEPVIFPPDISAFIDSSCSISPFAPFTYSSRVVDDKRVQVQFFGLVDGNFTCFASGNVSDVAGNPLNESSVFSSRVRYETTAPLIYYPATNDSIPQTRISMNVSFLEDIAPGSVYISFSNATAVALVINLRSSVLNFAALSSCSVLGNNYVLMCNGTGLTRGITYSLEICFQDILRNAPACSVASNLLFAPYIRDNSVTVDGILSSNKELNISGGNSIAFYGVFAAPSITLNVNVSYGIGALTYPCIVTAANTTFISCNSTAGIGRLLRLSVILSHYSRLAPYVLESTDTMQYPKPVIKEGTLRMGEPSGSTTNNINLLGTSVLAFFEGSGWGGNLKSVSVLLMPLGEISGCEISGACRVCPICPSSASASYCNSTSLACLLPAGLSGTFQFVVVALNSKSDHSNFTATYPAGPIVTSVNGCANSLGATYQCATNGSNLITLNGLNFKLNDKPLAVSVDFKDCPVLNSFWNDTQVICQLPAGTASSRVIQVFSLYSSFPAPLVSYATPVVTQVSVEGQPPVNLSRTGADKLTIEGSDFGIADAAVFIGTTACSDVKHDAISPSSRLTCTLPAATGSQSLSIAQWQVQGIFPTSFNVSFRPCPIGSENGLSPGSCKACEIGRYRSVETESPCLPCPVAFFAPSTGLAACRAASVGYFVKGQGLTNQTVCEAGFFSEGAASVCTMCEPGKWSSVGSGLCHSCQPGKFANATFTMGASSCTNCTLGSIAPKVGAAKCDSCLMFPGSIPDETRTTCRNCPKGTNANSTTFVCDACASGTYAVNEGQTRCDDCVPGKYQNASAQAECVDCPRGTSFNQTGAITCTECFAGSYATFVGQVECTRCEPGKSSNVQAATDCSLCEAGYFSRSAGQQTCTSCPRGTFNSIRSSSFCTDCSPGRSSLSNSTECVECIQGSYAPITRSENCTECERGKASQIKAATGCSFCAPGNFTNTTGRQRCSVCPIGSYSRSPGSSNCTTCKPGSAQATAGYPCTECSPGEYAEAGARVCIKCEIGKASRSAGSPNCTPCLPGTWSAFEGAAVCDACQPGQATLKGSGPCTSCQVGRFSSDEASTTCEACGFGTSTTDIGQSSCTNCSAGEYGLGNGSLCAPCSPGSSSISSGSSVCSKCSVGKFSSVNGSSICQLCEAGKYANGTLGQSACVFCAEGKNNSIPGSTLCADCKQGKSSLTGALECNTCIGNQFTLSYGEKCRACDPIAKVNEAHDRCVCPASTYGSYVKNHTCLPCPTGADCREDGIEDSSLLPLPGYWQSNISSMQFYLCILAEHCLSTGCSALRTGPLCMLCYEGYQESMLGGECENCAGLQSSNGGIIGVVIFFTFVLVIAVYLLILKLTDDNLKVLRREYGDALFDPGQSTNVNHPSDVLSESEMGTLDKLPLWRRSRRAPSLSQKAKIIVSFFQVITSGFLQRVPWPTEYRDFTASMGVIFNIDFVPWQRLRCVFHVSFLEKSRWVASIPLFLAIIILVFWFALWMYDRGRPCYSPEDHRHFRVLSNIKIWKLTTFSVFLLYPYVSSNIMAVYNCREVDGQLYLIRDFTILCSDPAWLTSALVNIIFLIIYPIGIPALYFYLLRSSALRDPLTIVKLGFLYEAYGEAYWYFELVDLLFKLALTSLVIFFPVVAELTVGMCIIILYIVAVFVCNPFIGKGNDRLRLLALTELYLLAHIGLILLSEGGPDLHHTLITAMLIGVPVCFLIFAIVVSIRNARKLLVVYRQDKVETSRRTSRAVYVDSTTPSRRVSRAPSIANQQGSSRRTSRAPSVALNPRFHKVVDVSPEFSLSDPNVSDVSNPRVSDMSNTGIISEISPLSSLSPRTSTKLVGRDSPNSTDDSPKNWGNPIGTSVQYMSAVGDPVGH